MFDETNQAEEIKKLPAKLFDDEENAEKLSDKHLTEEDGGEPMERFDEGAPQDEPEAVDDEMPQMIQIKFNGEQIEIPLEQAIVLAQKGMNYDHVLEERDTRYKRELDLIDKYAARSGISRAEYLEHLENSEHEDIILEEMEKIAEKYPDMPPEAVQKIAEMQVQQNEAEQMQHTQHMQMQEADARLEPWKMFFGMYPQLSVDDVPPEIYEAVDGGTSPVEAYQKLKLAEMQEKLAALEKNREVSERAIGSVRGDATEKLHDAFLDGFLGRK